MPSGACEVYNAHARAHARAHAAQRIMLTLALRAACARALAADGGGGADAGDGDDDGAPRAPPDARPGKQAGSLQELLAQAAALKTAQARTRALPCVPYMHRTCELTMPCVCVREQLREKRREFEATPPFFQYTLVRALLCRLRLRAVCMLRHACARVALTSYALRVCVCACAAGVRPRRAHARAARRAARGGAGRGGGAQGASTRDAAAATHR